MSTQSINEVTINTLRDKVDKALMCVGNKLIVEDKFGVRSEVNKGEVFQITYFKKFLKYGGCIDEVDTQFLENINKLTLKYN